MAKRILLHKSSEDKNQKNISKAIFEEFLQATGKKEHRHAHVCNTYIHKPWLTLRQADKKEHSKWSIFFKTSSWYASRLMFSFKFCMFDISTFGSEELWEMEGDLCSAEKSSVRPWQQSLLEGSHRQQSKAMAGRERWVSVKILSLKPSHRKTGVKARNPYLFLMQPQQTERHFF